MNDLFFWKQWPANQRIFYQGLLIFFLLAFAFFIFSYFFGIEAVIDWETLSVSEIQTTIVDKFNLGLFTFSYDANNYLIIDSFRGSTIQVNTLAAYIFLVFSTLSIVVAISVFTYLRGFWFYFGILVVVGLFTTFRLENLLLFGKANDTALIIVLVLFMLPYYYFNKINPRTNWTVRFITFVVSTTVFGLIIYFFAAAENSFLILANYGIAAPLVLSILFIFLVAHEIVAGFLKIITQNNTFGSKNTMLHFSILTVIYLVNVFLAYLHNTQVIDWDIVYVSAFILLPISAIVGIWGVKQRETLYDNLFPFRSQGALLYLALGTITFITIAYFFITGNDPVIETFEDAIIFSHFGYGFLFYLYVVVNFIDPLMANKQVYKVVYKPTRFPYATSQIGGFIVVLAFFLEANMFPFYQAVAGYYNGIGDIHTANEELFTAEQYYKLGNQYASQNHRSNYSLASLAQKQGDEGMNVYYLQQALLKKPTPYAYVNLSNAYQRNGRFFDALFSLREGAQQFPESEQIQLNLGLAYGKTKALDSALLMLDEARSATSIKHSAEADLLALVSQNVAEFGIEPDSVVNEFLTETGYMPSKVNAIGLLNRQFPATLPERFEEPALPEDTLLTQYQFAYLYNYLFNQRGKADTALIRNVETLANHSGNFMYSEPLTYGHALAMYEDVRLTEAFFAMDRLQAANFFKRGYYNHIRGLMALANQAPQLAAGFFDMAAESEYPDATINQAIALTEATGLPYGDAEVAEEAWQKVLTEDSLQANKTAQQMLKILNYQDFQNMEKEDDTFKYQLLRICGGKLPITAIDMVLNQINDINYKAAALLDLSEKFPQLDSILWSTHEIARNNDALRPYVKANLQWRQLERLVQKGETKEIGELLPTLTPSNVRQKSIALFCKALLAAEEGNTEKADEYFHRLFDNPFYPEGIAAARAYFTQQGADDFEIYNRLLTAMEVNPYSTIIHENYILQSLKLGLDNYAADAYQNLQKLATSEGYKAFTDVYQKKLKEKTLF